MQYSYVGIVILVSLLAVLIFSQVIDKNSFCNCAGMSTKYSTPVRARKMQFRQGYGWPVGTPYDSFSRQMLRSNMKNECAPNMMGVAEMSCKPNQFQAMNYQAPKKCGGYQTAPVPDQHASPEEQAAQAASFQHVTGKAHKHPHDNVGEAVLTLDFENQEPMTLQGSILKSYKAPVSEGFMMAPNPMFSAPSESGALQGPVMASSAKEGEVLLRGRKSCCPPDYGSASFIGGYGSSYSSGNQRETLTPDMTLKSPECAYKNVYTFNRGAGRLGYGSLSGGLPAYGQLSSGCGLPMLAAGPPSCQGPAGSFVAPPPAKPGVCDNSNGYNLAIGVM